MAREPFKSPFKAPFRVEQYFASDSYYWQVLDAGGRRVADVDSEPEANSIRDRYNESAHRKLWSGPSWMI